MGHSLWHVKKCLAVADWPQVKRKLSLYTVCEIISLSLSPSCQLAICFLIGGRYFFSLFLHCHTPWTFLERGNTKWCATVPEQYCAYRLTHILSVLPRCKDDEINLCIPSDNWSGEPPFLPYMPRAPLFSLLLPHSLPGPYTSLSCIMEG